MKSNIFPLIFSQFVSALFIDTSNYLPNPPSSEQPSMYHNSTTIQDQQFPYTSQYEKLYGKPMLECMKQVEALFHNEVTTCSQGVATSTNSTEEVDCQCLFMKYIEEDCFDIGLNDSGLWDLEKLDYPECKFI